MKRTDSIRFRISATSAILLLIIGMGILIPLSARMNGLISKWKAISVNAAEELLLYAAESRAEKIKAALESPLEAAGILANTLEAHAERHFMSRDEVGRILRIVLERNDDFLAVYTGWEPRAFDDTDVSVTRKAGRFISSWSRDDAGNINFEPMVDYSKDGPGDYYRLPVSTGRAQIISPYLYPVQGKDVLMTSMVVPIRLEQQTLGMAGVDIRLDSLQPLVDSLAEGLYGGKVAVYVITNEGTIVAANGNPEAAGQSLKEYHSNWESEVQVIQSGERKIEVAEGKMMVYAPIWIGNISTPWGLLIEVPESIVTASADQDSRQENRMLMLILFFSGVGIAAGIAFMIFITGTFTRPIETTATVLKGIAEGEGDLTKRIPETGKDETGEMARYFNLTMAKISRLVISVKDETDTLREVGDDLSANMNETAAAVNQITANIESVRNQTVNQSAGVTEARATVEEIVKNIGLLGSSIEEQAAGVTESSASIEQMVTNIVSVSRSLEKNAESVASLRDASELGRKDTRETAQLVSNIAVDSEGLVEASSLILNIAGQTNLLAMNAAIEAAHAGEYGKGFAVVADEIRKLAENAGLQAKSITSVLKKLKNSIDAVAISSSQSLERFEHVYELTATVSEQELIIKNAMDEQSIGGKQVLEALSQINTVTGLVKDGSARMLSGSKEVLNEMGRLSQITHEISDGMNEMASGAGQITEAVTQVTELGQKNELSIGTLSERVGRFKTT